MNCKKMKGLIYADYIDGNLKGSALEELERHIGSCTDCRALVKELREAGKLLRAVGRQEAPPKVWHNILAEISSTPVRSRFLEDAMVNLRYHLSNLRPAMVVASAVVILLFALAVMRYMPNNSYLDTAIARDDILAISYYSDDDDEPEYDLGTSVETLFL